MNSLTDSAEVLFKMREKDSYWKQHTTYSKPIIKQKKDSKKIDLHSAQKIIQNLALKAMQDLKDTHELFTESIKAENINREIICSMCNLCQKIAIIVDTIFIQPSQDKDSRALEDYRDRQKLISEQITKLESVAVDPCFNLNQLKKLHQDTSTWKALCGADGLFSESVLAKTLDIDNLQTMQRLLCNCGLETVEQLISLIEENKTYDNLLMLLRSHINQSREKARSNMNAKEQKQFDEDWSRTESQAWILNNSITIYPPWERGNKFTEQDYLKYLALQKELASLEQTEKFLKQAGLYKGPGGDFYLKISATSDIQQQFPETVRELFQKGKNHFLWSQDGKKFYFLQASTIYAKEQTYQTKLGLEDRCVLISANQVFAILRISHNKANIMYERQDLKASRKLFNAFNGNEAEIIPSSNFNNPIFHFQFPNKNKLIIEETSDLPIVHLVSNGSEDRMEVDFVKKCNTEKSMQIALKNGGCISIPYEGDALYRTSSRFSLELKEYYLTELGSVPPDPDPVEQIIAFHK